jgi:hypothetical protein
MAKRKKAAQTLRGPGPGGSLRVAHPASRFYLQIVVFGFGNSMFKMRTRFEFFSTNELLKKVRW